jgi:hypothetical protein
VAGSEVDSGATLTSRPLLLATLPAALLALLPVRAWATPPSTRAIGMADSLRGNATGDAALSENPSGMSLARTYVLEAAYLHDRIGDGTAHNAHVSIVDSTSPFNVAGGVYYTYLNDSPESPPGRSGHEGGLALSFPIGERFFFGATVKYLRVRTDDPLPAGAPRTVSGFGFDLGATVRPISTIGIGLAATNVADASLGDRAPRTLGGGVAVNPTDELLLSFDAVRDLGPEKFWRFGGGGEFLFAKRVAVRAGGGYRQDTRSGLLSVGLTLLSDVAALDLGAHQDLSGARKELLVGVSGRIFVPSP